jgi:transposase-like protein
MPPGVPLDVSGVDARRRGKWLGRGVLRGEPGCGRTRSRADRSVEQYANNPIEADHAHLKRRLRPMRGIPTDRTAQIVIGGHAVLQNLRRGHYELGVDARPALRVAIAFTELAEAI